MYIRLSPALNFIVDVFFGAGVQTGFNQIKIPTHMEERIPQRFRFCFGIALFHQHVQDFFRNSFELYGKRGHTMIIIVKPLLIDMEKEMGSVAIL